MGKHFKLRRRRIVHLAPQEVAQKRGTKVAVCESCGQNEARVEADNKLVWCSECVQRHVAPPPAPKPPLTQAERELRAARKLERVKRKAAKEQGLIIAPKDLGFVRGWHRRKLFKTEIGEHGEKITVRYFSYGKEITAEEYDKIAKDSLSHELNKTAPTSGWGRGWHLKKHFVAPDGTVWSHGKKIQEPHPVE